MKQRTVQKKWNCNWGTGEPAKDAKSPQRIGVLNSSWNCFREYSPLYNVLNFPIFWVIFREGLGKLYWHCHQVALLVVQENTSFDIQQSFHLRVLCFAIKDPGSQAHSPRARAQNHSPPSPTCASVSLPTHLKGRNLWKDHSMQFGKTGRKHFLIKQKNPAALLARKWCGTGLERKLSAIILTLSAACAIGSALLFAYEYWLRTLVLFLKPLKPLVKLSLIWAGPRLDSLWLFRGHR